MDQREIWDNIAPEWQKYRKKPREDAMDFLNGKGGIVLDLGCGSGRNFVKGPVTVGFDFSAKMLEYARRKSKKSDINSMLVAGDAEELPFGDNTFDHILCANTLHVIKKSEHRHILQEIKRVAKNGSYVFISVWNKNQPRFQNSRRETITPWESHGKKYDRYCYLYTKDELKSLLKRSGFSNIRIFGSKDKSFYKFPKNLITVSKVRK